jgi:hypothetical protein
MQSVHASRIPSHAQSVVRSGNTAAGSTLYTVPAGKTLVLLSAWLSFTGGAGATTGRIDVSSEDDDSTQSILAANSGAAGLRDAQVATEVRLKAGTSIVAASTGTPANFNYGFSGYLDRA